MRKEAGAYYHTRCPECGYELAIGWLTDQPQPMLGSDVNKVILSTRDEVQGMVFEPQVCGCGKTRLSLHPEAHRAVLEWDTATEPKWICAIRWGSLRDLAQQ